MAIQSLHERTQSGHALTPDDVALLMRSSVIVQYHTARTLYAVGQFHDRRECVPASRPAAVERLMAAFERVGIEEDGHHD
jgi:hypothetical protein